jgi:hypothetical protein
VFVCFQHDPRKPRARPLLVKQPAIPNDVVAYIAGQPIADLCQGVPTYFVVEQPHDEEAFLDDSSEEVTPGTPAGTPGRKYSEGSEVSLDLLILLRERFGVRAPTDTRILEFVGGARLLGAGDSHVLQMRR